MLEHFHWDDLCHAESVADNVFHVAKRLNNVGVRQGCNWNDGFLWKDISRCYVTATSESTLIPDGNR